MSSIDPKRFGKVAVLLGGQSAEREVSLKSGSLVLKALRDAGVDAHPFDPAERRCRRSRTRASRARVHRAARAATARTAKSRAHSTFTVSVIRGPGVLGSALGLDKFRRSSSGSKLGVPTPPFEAVMRGDDYAARAADIVAKLGLPLFVKPASEGSSVAVTKVKTAEALPAALEEAAKFDKIVVVEKSIEGGGEYTACIAGDLDLPIIKIVPAGEFYDYHAKYIADDTQYLIPCGLPADEEKRLKAVSRRAFEVLGCTDWGRADFMLDANGNAYFLEVNTAPGMTDHSLPPKAARAVGISYQDLVVGVLALTLSD
ncbi:D-alanine--D-alanine ligase [Trinickia sp. NRRL B-1857]|uniref:D-alanine--D-alanine ligase n=1 Tax=Trinickia sp. NRRL B-1857 TaxID=3162879 RepID=UPI003D2BC5E4